jgi:hypothetical protein
MCIGMANGGKQVANDGKKVLPDKEIKKALDDCLTKDKVELYFITSENKFASLKIADILDLINRQQKQLENYSHKVRTMAKDICRYKAKIDRLKDKNLELLNKLLPYEEYPPLENIIEEKESDTE